MKNIGIIVLFISAVVLILVFRSKVYDHVEVFSTRAADFSEKEENDDILQLHFHERRPYYMRYKNNVYGLVAGPVGSLLEKADIRFEWIETPAGRQLDIIKDGVSPICAVGWFKTPQRQRYGRYSLPIYQDKKLVAVARSDDERMKKEDLLDRVLSDGRLKLLVKNGYSYGGFVSKRMEELGPWKIITTADNVGILEMIRDMRADYSFMSEEEAYDLLVHSSLDSSKFKIVHFQDLPEGSKRYLICSRKVDDATMNRINAAIAHFIKIPEDN